MLIQLISNDFFIPFYRNKRFKKFEKFKLKKPFKHIQINI